ncbi:amidohydrolase family protein [Acetivibrio ethanolgignens]|uniref:Amidohydrolase n=1 Tax=Acetivibrio ethanolgignens TaxID=290052 RepID=A0A0V8QD64_9FIRM|nr:amidohydrolase [Acetivibrio ethanolgignens]KSV58468.1 amidohydrolase [Acetivibrio ethanolgignens]
MNIRFYNVRLITMEGGVWVEEGELWVKGNKIAYVGAENKEAAAKESWDREIDGQGNVLMPGFKDAHTHSAMTFLRSYADDLPLLDWLHKQVFPMEAKLCPEHIAPLTKLAIMEYLTSGITANLDMYYFAEEIARAAIETGFRTVIQGSVGGDASGAERLRQEYEKFKNFHELISYQLGFHAEYTASRELLEAVAALAEEYKQPVFTHNSESESEVAQCIEKTGMTPTAYLDSLGIFNYGGTTFHCVHMTDEDLDICKKRNISVVTNPGSNTKLASGVARINDMLKWGINLGIGTDGPASNNCLDMFREMFLVTGLGKLKEKDAAAIDANDVLYMATAGGAKAMGLTDCDTLKEGKLADLVMIDLHQPNMQPLNNIAKNIVYSGSKQNVKLTMVNGRVLYEDGKFYIGEEPEAIYAKANEIIQEFKK